MKRPEAWSIKNRNIRIAAHSSQKFPQKLKIKNSQTKFFKNAFYSLVLSYVSYDLDTIPHIKEVPSEPFLLPKQGKLSTEYWLSEVRLGLSWFSLSLYFSSENKISTLQREGRRVGRCSLLWSWAVKVPRPSNESPAWGWDTEPHLGITVGLQAARLV